MLQLIRTNSDNHDFKSLVVFLDAYLAEKDGDEHVFYARLNTIGGLKHVVVAYDDELPVGCGAIKEAVVSGAMEVKRMYVAPEYRGKGIASAILAELERWSAELGSTKCVLETGKRQPEAIRLYEKSGYTVIPNYGQYQNVVNSVCFEKKLRVSG